MKIGRISLKGFSCADISINFMVSFIYLHPDFIFCNFRYNAVGLPASFACFCSSLIEPM